MGKFILMGVIIVAFIAGYIGFFTSFISQESLTVNATFGNDSRNTFINKTSDMYEIFDQNTSTSGNPSGDSYELGPKDLVDTAFATIRMTMELPQYFFNMISIAMSESRYFPDWVEIMLVSIVGIVAIGALIYLFTGREF